MGGAGTGSIVTGGGVGVGGAVGLGVGGASTGSGVTTPTGGSDVRGDWVGWIAIVVGAGVGGGGSSTGPVVGGDSGESVGGGASWTGAAAAGAGVSTCFVSHGGGRRVGRGQREAEERQNKRNKRRARRERGITGQDASHNTRKGNTQGAVIMSIHQTNFIAYRSSARKEHRMSLPQNSFH